MSPSAHSSLITRHSSLRLWHRNCRTRLTLARLARQSLSVRRDLRRCGNELFALLRSGDSRGALSVRRQSGADVRRPAGNYRLHLARLSAERRAGTALRLSRARTVGAERGTSLQSGETAARSV